MISVGVEWVNNFSAPCVNDDLVNRAECAEGFLDAMTARGFTSMFDWGDGNAWETDFRSNDNGGDALDWSDAVNFCYFADHGVNGGPGGQMDIGFTSQHEYCTGWSDSWRLGISLLRWFVLDTCDLVLDTDAATVSNWFGPMQGVHLLFGFVGEAYDDGGRGASFGSDAANGAVLSSAWLSDASSWWEGETAIAIAAGTTQDDATNRRDNETINWVYEDLPAETSWLAWKWYE
jgi:hypothetical protein